MAEDVGLAEAQKLLAEAQRKEDFAREVLRKAEERYQMAEEMLREANLRLAPVENAQTLAAAHRIAYEDGLTALPNLQLLQRYLEFNLAQVDRYGRSCALLALDIDRFRLVNENLGFAMGDKLLQAVAERLQSVLRGSDILARKGEDEFLILLSEVGGGRPGMPLPLKDLQERLGRIAVRFLECLRDPFQVEDQLLHVSASAGVSIAPADAKTVDQMLEHCDAALYSAKESGRGRVEIYSQELRERITRRLNLENQLRSALRDQEFLLRYLPVVHLETRQVIGLEALVRWQHPLRGELLPEEFMEVAEESGLIVPIGRWVFYEACKHLSGWQRQGLDVFLNLNLSAQQLLAPDFSLDLAQVLEGASLKAEKLLMDVSEQTFADKRVHDVLADLQQVGFRVAIDDFGSGFSNLKTIRLSQTRILKVDRELVEGLPHDRNSLSLCVAAIKMASGLNLQSLAEGVETEEQYRFLCNNDCHLGQGFYFSEPVAPGQVVELVTRGNNHQTVVGSRTMSS